MTDRFPAALRHPDLRELSESGMARRTDFWPRLLYWVPREQWINWYGDMIRETGGRGMYATAAQHAAWSRKSRSDTTIGPR